MAKFKITKTNSTSGGYGQGTVVVDAYMGQTLPTSGAHYGGTGGNTSITGRQIQPAVKVGTNAAALGSIQFQIGRNRFRVNDGTNVGDCTLTNAPLANLSASTMSIQVNTTAFGFANIYTSGALTNYALVNYSTANVSGPVSETVAASLGYQLFNTGLVGNVTVSSIATSGANVTLNCALSVSQTITANPSTGAGNVVYMGFQASRITNKYVSDYSSSGNYSTNISGGYTPNKYRYHLAAPDSTFVQVVSA
jgi:hypothetical protein